MAAEYSLNVAFEFSLGWRPCQPVEGMPSTGWLSPAAADDAVPERGRGAARVVQLGELVMILDLHRQGLSVTAIARRTGRDPKTVRKYIERGLELPVYGPRQVGRPGKLLPFVDYVRERLAALPDLTATSAAARIRERGYAGAYSPVKRFVAAIRPNDGPRPYEVRFETPPDCRRRSTLPASWSPSRKSPASTGSSGCSAWCSGTRGTSSRASFSIRICDATSQSRGGLRSDRRRCRWISSTTA